MQATKLREKRIAGQNAIVNHVAHAPGHHELLIIRDRGGHAYFREVIFPNGCFLVADSDQMKQVQRAAAQGPSGQQLRERQLRRAHPRQDGPVNTASARRPQNHAKPANH